jgi:predicted CXXCH cytochrome family protein
MRKLLIAFAILTLIAGASGVALAGIDGSSHDLGDDSLGTTEICVFCHVPHNPKAGADGPLWNHLLTTQKFTLYDGTTNQDSSGISRLCLSCHDGVTNIDAFGSSAGSTDIDTKFSGTTANIGLDLQDDHPVMVTMPDGTGGFNARSSVDGTQAKLFGSSTDTVECASCHDPHLTDNGHFLRVDNGGSVICLDCHNK